MAFLSAPVLPVSRARRAAVCRTPPRLTATPPPSEDEPATPPRKLPVTNSEPSTRKLTRNKPGMASDNSAVPSSSVYADGRAGDMVGGPEVGEGLGPRRGASEKKVTRAAAIQKSQTFADAWAEQNEGKLDVWLIIGALTLLTPILILLWAIATGVIPTAGIFED